MKLIDVNNLSLEDAAIFYAQHGIPILPVWGIGDNGRCLCELFAKRQHSACNHPGKHPHNPNGVNRATCDLNKVTKWWKKIQNLNIGIATGKPSQLIALDVDIDKGGAESLEELGNLPTTLKVRTGGGGQHLFFQYTEELEIKNSVSKLGKGLDIRTTGGFLVAPPSKHISGNTYKWMMPDAL